MKGWAGTEKEVPEIRELSQEGLGQPPEVYPNVAAEVSTLRERRVKTSH